MDRVKILRDEPRNVVVSCVQSGRCALRSRVVPHHQVAIHRATRLVDRGVADDHTSSLDDGNKGFERLARRGILER